MTRLLSFTAIALLLAATASAQVLPTAGERRAAEIASYITVGTAVALDIKASWDSPDRGHVLLLNGTRLGVTWAATAAIKHYFPHPRPCAPADCGINDPLADVPSGHTAFGFSTIGGPRLAVSVPLAVSTGILRRLTNAHDWLGVLTGAGVGYATSFIR